MRASTINGRSIVLGTLLAALSAGCLIAFTLVAGSADYPTRGPVIASQPRTAAAPVNLVARVDNGGGDRSPRVRPDPGADPSAPIVLGIRVSNPDGRNDDGRGGRREGRRDGGGKNGSGSRDEGSKKPSDRDSDGDPTPPHLAKPIANPGESKTFESSNGNGNAYGHYKKPRPSGTKSGGPSAASNSQGNGPPAHAQANGHDKSSGPPPHAASGGNGSSSAGNESQPSSSSSEDGSGPPPHASSNGSDKAPGPPDHAQANGHDKAEKDKT